MVHFTIGVVVAVLVLVALLVSQFAEATCSISLGDPGPRRVYPEIYRWAQRDFVPATETTFTPRQLKTQAPKLYTLSDCEVPSTNQQQQQQQPQQLFEPSEQESWRARRLCNRMLVKNVAQLRAVSRLVDEGREEEAGQHQQQRHGAALQPEVRRAYDDADADAAAPLPPAPSAQQRPRRKSYRAEWQDVDVEWPLLREAVQQVQELMWPQRKSHNGFVQLEAELQTVLMYGRGDMFAAHRDRCQVRHQEGVLIVDLGLRGESGDDDVEAHYVGNPELFLHNLPHAARADPEEQYFDTAFPDVGNLPAAPLAGNWSAAHAGDFVAFPMHRIHGVYEQKATRVVAVYTLFRQCQCRPLCGGTSLPVSSCPHGGRCVGGDAVLCPTT